MASLVSSTLLVLILVWAPCHSTVIDLTHIYGDDVLYPPVGPGGTSKMFNFTIMQRGYSTLTKSWLELNWFGMFEHGSTHVDAPVHFVEGRPRLHEVPAEHLIAPGVMIDITDNAKENPDYETTIDDIKSWEATHGEIPKRAIVMQNSGWHKKYPNRNAFYGTETPDDMSSHRFPGLHVDTAKWLMTNRQITGFGTDCGSCDRGQNGGEYLTHVALLSNEVLIFEMVANLDKMPPQGTTVFAGALKLRNGSGGPCRLIALTREELGLSGAAPNGNYAFGLVAILLLMVFLYRNATQTSY